MSKYGYIINESTGGRRVYGDRYRQRQIFRTKEEAKEYLQFRGGGFNARITKATKKEYDDAVRGGDNPQNFFFSFLHGFGRNQR